MKVDWIPARITDEGKCQQPRQRQPLGITKLRQSDGHVLMAFDRLSAIGAEQPVPPGQIEAEIAVGFADDHGVMHPVHVRGDHEISQYAVKSERDSDITVIERRGDIRSPITTKVKIPVKNISRMTTSLFIAHS